MKVVYDFNATQKGQMTVKKGDILDVVPASDKSHAGWIKVIKNGDKGYIPHNYTKVHAAAAKVAGGAVFGVQLKTMMERPSETERVPAIVEEILARLTELGASECDGIFRWPGAEAACKTVMLKYNAGERGGSVTSVSDNAADWATILQRWNRMLPCAHVNCR